MAVRRGINTPNQLRIGRAVVVVLAVAWSVLGAFGINRRHSAIDDIGVSSRQLIAVQDIRVALVRADSIASSSYLVGGQEDPAQRATYLADIDTASAGIVDVANAVPEADAAVLRAASSRLAEYVGLVEQARANNRQGFPVGAAYQRQANAVMTATSAAAADPDSQSVVELLRAVEQRQRDRINQSMRTAERAGGWLHVLGWLLGAAIAAALAIHVRRFHRYLNVPLAVAGLLIFVVMIVASSSQGSSMRVTNDAVDGPLRGADQMARTRAAAFDARSQEALSLVNRGNGQANEDRWQMAAADVETITRQCADGCARDAFSRYENAHAQLRRLDNEGDWEAAVAAHLGIGSVEAGNVVENFVAFTDESESILRDSSRRATEAFASAGDGLSGTRVLVFVAGLVAAVLAVAGFNARLREYR